MKDVVIYHAGCWDGFCAAWLFHYWLPQAKFIPAQYGDDPPDLTEASRVAILDFSYPRETLIEMAENCDEVLVLDHHETAQKELEDLNGWDSPRLSLGVHFDMDKSGGMMAWDYLRAHDRLPDFLKLQEPHWLVKYTEDRDLWRHALPGTKEINAALRSEPLTFECWDGMARRQGMLEDLMTGGTAILRYKQVLVDQHVRFARHAEVNGHKFAAVNCSTGDIISEVAGTLAESHPFGATWTDQGDGNQLWSLRSRGDVDVSIVARELGGGGHAQASGFKCEVGKVKIGDRIK